MSLSQMKMNSINTEIGSTEYKVFIPFVNTLGNK